MPKALLLAVCVSSLAEAAFGQSPLQRLEERIREEVRRATDGDPKKPPPPPVPTPGAPVPAPAAAAATPAPAAAAVASPVYLGIVADDQNDRGRGVRVVELLPGGPAEKAGIEAGDLIVGLAGMRVRQMSEMADILELYAPGETVNVDLQRNDKSQKVSLVLAARPGQVAPPAAAPPTTPPPAAAAADDAGLEAAIKRIEQLEARVTALERAARPSEPALVPPRP